MEGEVLELYYTVMWLALGLSIVFGAVAQKTGFCTLGAVYDIAKLKQWNRMRGYLLAIAVAIIGTNLMDLYGVIDVFGTQEGASASIYVNSELRWLSHVVGGLVFGFGMTWAVGCGNKTLVRIGAGSLRSLLITIVMAGSAWMTVKGLFGVFRTEYLDPVSLNLAQYDISSQSFTHIIGAAFGMDAQTAQWAMMLAFGVPIIIWAFAAKEFRADRNNVFAGIAVGLIAVGGWYITGHVAAYYDDFEGTMMYLGSTTGTPESYTFVNPVYQVADKLALYTAYEHPLNFGILAVVGVVLGAFIVAKLTKEFAWEGFRSITDIKKSIVAGIAMGFGGVTAMGCTIGQGISGFSTLALGSIITFLSICVGSYFTYKIPSWLVEYEDEIEEFLEESKLGRVVLKVMGKA